MACRNGGGLQNQEQDRRSSSSSSSSVVNEALIMTTMCIVGLPVDVHVRNGAVYSAIFYTADVEGEYDIVLKQARMTKKGRWDSNLPNDGVFETLIIHSKDLVQVVAKRVLPPANGFAGHETGDDTGAVACTSSNGTPSVETNTTSSKSNVDQLHIGRTRCLSAAENGFVNGLRPQHATHSSNALEVNGNANSSSPTKKEGALNDPTNNKRQIIGYGSQGDSQSNGTKIENTALEVQESHPNSVEDVDVKMSKIPATGVVPDGSTCSSPKRQEAHASPEVMPSIDGVRSRVSATVSSESFNNLSSTAPTETIAPKTSNSNRTTKEFKLNPGAKIFSPSFPSKRSITPPAVPVAAANLTYIPENYPAVPVATAQPEVEISQYAPRSLPVKLVPYGNLLSGNGGSEAQHSSIVGYMTNRSQPVRYGGQYHPVQAAPTYVQPSTQNMMIGRLGQVVYVHPVSQDMVQSTTGFSQVSTCSILTPHQVHVPKHQGTAAAQAMQLCGSPPIISGGGGGQPQFVMPSHMPISQPPYHPIIRPISVPGSNGFLVSKFS